MHSAARVAAKGDVGVLVELYRAYRDCLEGERGGTVYLAKDAVAEPLEPHFESIIDDSGWLVLLGTFEEAPVGLATVRLDSVDDSSIFATVEVLYVDPEAREVGVGEELAEAAALWATQQGATGLDVPVLPGMRESKNFLEGSGFVARLLVMHKTLQAY
jgi:GNAT superfamily N-acetyltransferase